MSRKKIKKVKRKKNRNKNDLFFWSPALKPLSTKTRRRKTRIIKACSQKQP